MTLSQKCEAETKESTPCKNPKWKNTNYCYIHRDFAIKDGQQINVNLLDRLSGLFQTSRKARISAFIGFLIGLVGFINALTGNSFIEFMENIIPCTWPSTCVDELDTLDIAYMMLEGQLEAYTDCPEDLPSGEWGEFRGRLKTLNFNRLDTPYDIDFEKYRNKFVEFLSDPPEDSFDCGVMWGELLLAARPMLVDLEINESKAMSDGQGVPLAKGIGEMITGELGLKNQYLLSLGFEPERFEKLDPEARAFVEYLSIWMVMYFENERISAVERAQGALLGMSLEDLYGKPTYGDYKELHEDLILLSRSHVDGNQTGIVRHGSRAIYILSDLSLSVITDELALYIGGDRLLQIVQKMNEIALGGISDLHELEQLIETFKFVTQDN